jgi:hypothetical protein
MDGSDVIENLEQLNIVIKFLKKQLKDIKDSKNPDIEVYHSLEDQILHIFIKLIASNKLKKQEIVDTAKDISIINKYMDKIGRWYA